MKKEKKNNFIVLKTLLCLILLGVIALGICAYRFARVSINVSSETGKLKVNDMICYIVGTDSEVEFKPQSFSTNTYYGNGMIYAYDYYISFELDNQPYELCFSHSRFDPHADFYVANVKIIVNVLDDGRIKITATENGDIEIEEIFEKDEELNLRMRG